MFFSGVLIACLLSLPLGSVGAIAISRTIEYGRWSGWLSGLGAATTDFTYLSLAVLGFNLVSGFFTKYEWLVKLIGGIILLAIGITFFIKARNNAKPKIKKCSKKKSYGSTLLIGLTNPNAIFLFPLLFTGEKINPSSTIVFLLGAITGFLLTWTLIIKLASLIGNQIKDKTRIMYLCFGSIALIGATIFFEKALELL